VADNETRRLDKKATIDALKIWHREFEEKLLQAQITERIDKITERMDKTREGIDKTMEGIDKTREGIIECKRDFKALKDVLETRVINPNVAEPTEDATLQNDIGTNTPPSSYSLFTGAGRFFSSLPFLGFLKRD
jgi:hypothetical protein